MLFRFPRLMPAEGHLLFPAAGKVSTCLPAGRKEPRLPDICCKSTLYSFGAIQAV